MREITSTIKAFQFEELTEEQKQKAYEKNGYDLFHGWWQFVYDDAIAIGEKFGIHIENIYFSGFSSQGDGACFEGTFSYQKGGASVVKNYAPNDKELHDIVDQWQKLQRQNFYSISGKVRQSGHYNHSGCTVFDFEDSRDYHGFTNSSFDEESFSQCLRDFMDWIYNRLEEEHDCLTSFESFAESAKANEWEFTEDGTMI